MFKFDKRILTHFDYIQVILILPIIILSFYLINQANEILSAKQIIYFGVGFACFLFFFFLPLRRLKWLIPLAYWLGVILLLSVDIFGVEMGGAKRWLIVPGTNFTIQPSEFFKPIFILMLAYLISQNPPPKNGYKIKKFLKISFYIFLPFFLISQEPDLGTALVLLIVGFGALFLVGIYYKIWLSIILMIILASPLIYTHFIRGYQKERIQAFVSGDHSYQVAQSIIAIGNGGLFGKEKDEALQTNFKFLPIATSDFIFAYLIERFGFFGGFFVILLYALLIFHILSLNKKLKNDHFVCVSLNCVALFIFIYAGVNISMTLGFAPVVGIPLPFFSYGGSSFTTFMIFFGILQNLLTFRFHWDDVKQI